VKDGRSILQRDLVEGGIVNLDGLLLHSYRLPQKTNAYVIPSCF
jgi:hypothetical protein